MNTPPNRRAQQTRLTAIKEAQGKDGAANFSDVDKLLTFSPQAKVTLPNITFVRSFIHSFARSFFRSFFQLFVCSFVRSFFIHSFSVSFNSAFFQNCLECEGNIK